MLDELIFRQNPLIFAAILLVVLIVALEAPYRYGSRIVGDSRIKDEVWTTIYAGLLALVAFMLGLSFAQAQGRFDARRHLVVEEADAIGKTWLRADQLPPQEMLRFRATLTHYATTRLRAYELPRNLTFFDNTIAQSDADSKSLWRVASTELRAHPNNLGLALLMQSLNDMIDRSDDQVAALTQHIPSSVVVLTVLLVFLATLATGLSFARSKARPGIFGVIYIIALTLVIQVFVDLDRPQSGFIRVSLDPLREQITQMNQ